MKASQNDLSGWQIKDIDNHIASRWNFQLVANLVYLPAQGQLRF